MVSSAQLPEYQIPATPPTITIHCSFRYVKIATSRELLACLESHESWAYRLLELTVLAL